MKVLEILLVLAVAAAYAGWRLDARLRHRRGLPPRPLRRGVRIAAVVVLIVAGLVCIALGVSSGAISYLVLGGIALLGAAGLAWAVRVEGA